MKSFKFIQVALLVMLLIVPALTFGLTTFQDPVDTSPTAATIVQWATPFIVLLATWIVKAIKPIIPGWATMIVVTAISAAVTWASTLLDSPDLSWLQQFLFGLLAVFIHQFYKQFTASTAS